MRALRHTTTIVPGQICAGLIILFISASLIALWQASPTSDLLQWWNDPYLRHITRFSLFQAALSTLLSLALALPLSEALSRRHFRGRSLLLQAFSLTLVLPVLVAVMGLLAIYGRSGLLNTWFDSELSIYGLSGILLAHVFFNAPLASRMLLQSIESVPAQQWQLAAHLGLSRTQAYRYLCWPRIKQQLPHTAGLIFMLCFTSFATVMMLGGGPKYTTIELAIYQAIRFDFDLGLGAILALWQMLLCLSLTALLHLIAKPIESYPAVQQSRHFLSDSRRQRLWDGLWIGAGMLLVIPPLLAVVMAGINGETLATLQQPALWQAAWNSARIALSASVIALFMGLAILHTSRVWRLGKKPRAADAIELSGSLILVTPGLVISTGMFLLLRHYTNVFQHAFWLVVLVNALMALPFVIKTLAQPLLQTAQQYNHLCQSLGIAGKNRWYWVEWKLLGRPMAQAFGLALTLSLGDLTAIALFGSQHFQTLPWYLFQLQGGYRMEAASVVALLLLIASFSLFVWTERYAAKR
uniref:thiamine/thiamine pyrophosphate ABC transporter permease n=1 Tax=Thaumasiovibrio occultus TaxID=1891184 RepID=UPI000B352FB7|nr:thiamine/thiamine pyrophosphate ABC transporter permease [Thaumasiovibrio occultus]